MYHVLLKGLGLFLCRLWGFQKGRGFTLIQSPRQRKGENHFNVQLYSKVEIGFTWFDSCAFISMVKPYKHLFYKKQTKVVQVRWVICVLIGFLKHIYMFSRCIIYSSMFILL